MSQNNHSLRGIIFDKDGTLFNYAQVWAEVLGEAINQAFEAMGKSEQTPAKIAMLKLMGIDTEGNCIPKGLVFTHKKHLIVKRFLLYCLRYKIKPFKAFKVYLENVKNSEILIEEKLKTLDFSVQQELFCCLKSKGYHIGVITSDTTSSTRIFLNLMGIGEMVDFLSARDSQYKKKPHPQAFEAFCSRFSLAPEQVALVGDTQTDMKLAHNAKAGYTIALLSGSNDAKNLNRLSDVVYDDISSLIHDTKLFFPQIVKTHYIINSN